METSALIARLATLPRAVLAYSGGLHSTLVAALAPQAQGGRFAAVTVASAFTASRDLALAQAKARALGLGLGLDHHIMNLDVWGVAGLAVNGPERCYLCKRAVLGLVSRAFPNAVLLDGTNADDDPARPGRHAVAEMRALSPLALAGLTKAEVRALSAELGLPGADEPSNSCLATRIPQGTALTPSALARVEALEAFARGLGFSNLRCRDQGPLLRLELPASQLDAARRKHDDLLARALAAGFTDITLESAPDHDQELRRPAPGLRRRPRQPRGPHPPAPARDLHRRGRGQDRPLPGPAHGLRRGRLLPEQDLGPGGRDHGPPGRARAPGPGHAGLGRTRRGRRPPGRGLRPRVPAPGPHPRARGLARQGARAERGHRGPAHGRGSGPDR